MSIVGITDATQAQAQDTLSNRAMMQKDDFLRMLTMQLRHQDPMNPMSNDQFATQLAQFTQLETLTNINDSIQTQIVMSQSMNNSFMINMIGKDVKSYGNMVTLGENGATLNFELMGDATNVRITVMDDTNREVAVINRNAMKSGDRSITWDGKDKDGRQLPQGNYTFRVDAFGSNQNRIPTETMNNGIVTGVTFSGGMPFLIVNGNLVNLRDIISINRQPSTEAPGDG
jgi:flagellar basal-body rod modification protein FlgD